MASVVYLDTHVVAWLYGLGAESLSKVARTQIDAADELRISPMVRLELQYLHEIGRTTTPAARVLDEMQALIGLRMCDAPFAAVTFEAAKSGWTRDPFDRIIVAQAQVNDSPLISKDGHIRDHYRKTVW